MDVTEATFEQEVIERSHDTTVVVDFWAAWCGPCRQLAPALEAAVARRGDNAVLAKVDIDANPALAQRFRVMSIPAVKAFRAGEVVSDFVGMQPPAAIEAFLDRALPSVADRLVAAGGEPSLREAVAAEPGHVGARVALGRLLLADGRTEEMADLLRPVDFDPAAAALLARARLAGSDQPDIAAGLAALERDQPEAALAHLLDAVRVAHPELRDDLRAAMLGVFADLGEHHPLTSRFRKRLARALY